jgi:hypothetical protein
MPIIDPFAQEVSKPREIVDPFKLQKIVDPFAQAEAQPEAPQEESGFFRQAADLPVGVAKGAVQGIRMVADAFGANNPVSSALRGAENYLGDLMSAQSKNDQQEIARIMKEAEDKGMLDQVVAGVKAFAVAPLDLMSQAFGTVGVTVAGGLAANVARLAATGKVLTAGGMRATQAGIGAGMGAGVAKGEIYEAVKQELKESDVPEEIAEERAQIAQSYGGQNLDQILLSAGLGAVASATGAERILSKIGGPTGVKTVGQIAGAGAAEAAPEFLQGSQEQLAKNIALQREGFDVPTMRGVVGAGTLEAAAGFGVGAGARAITGPSKDEGPRTVEDEQIDALQKMQIDDMGEVAPPETKIGTGTTQIGDDAGRSKPSVSVSPGVDEAPTGTSGVDIGRVDSPIEDVDGTAVRATEVDTTLAPAETTAAQAESIVETPATDPMGFARVQALTSFEKRNSSDYSDPEEAIDFGLDNLNDTLTDYKVTDPYIREQAVEAYKNEITRLKNEAAPAVTPEVTPAATLAPEEATADVEPEDTDVEPTQAELEAAIKSGDIDKLLSSGLIGYKEVDTLGPQNSLTLAQKRLASYKATPAPTPEQKGQASLSITPSGTLTLPDLMRQEDPKLQEKFEEIRTGKKKVFKTYAPVVEDMQRTVDELSEFIRQQGVDPTNLASLRGATLEVQNAATLLSALGQDANNLTLAVKNQEINYARAKTPEAKAEVTNVIPQRKLAEAQNTIRVAREFIADPSKGVQDVMAFPRYRLATEGTEGMPVAKVEKLVQRMTAKWKNAPDIFVVQSTVDLEQYGLENINPRARGVFEPGTQSVFLIADNITDYTDAVITVAHESIGHFGLQSVLGGSYKKTMNRLYETNAEVRKLADVKMANEGLSKEVAVEEVLAEAVEQKVAPQSALGRALTTLRNVLRNFFRLLGVESSNSEIDSLITRAANYVIAGTVQVEKNVTKTDAFKNWFGDSVIRNLDGTPKIMYHGTAADFSLFKLKQANAIFVTADPEFADEFTLRSEEHMKTLAAKEKTTYTGGRNIMPLYVRAEKPFDYENREHVKEVLQIIKQNDPDYYTDFDLTVLGETIRNGSWQNIETTAVRRALDELGFDSFYVEENNRKNLAVFDPNQVKSATGNAGSFSRDSKDILLAKKADEFKPININSDNFKRFFSGSVVRNPDGSPMVVYHGTQADIAAFSTDAERVNRGENPDGFYFTSDPEEASYYAEKPYANVPNREFIRVAENANVMPVYLALTNPFNHGGTNSKFPETPVTQNMLKQFEKELRKENPDLDSSWYQEKLNRFKNNEVIPGGSISNTAKTRVIKAGGFDGMVDGRHFVVFEPTQIKSAITNTGAFDPTKSDIRYRKKATALTSGAKQIQTVFYSFKPEAGPNLQNPGKAPSKLQQLSGNRPVWDKVKGAFNLKSIGSLPPTAKQGMYKIMTLRMLKDLAGNRLPQMARAITVSEQMVAERSRIMRDGADILDKVQDLRKEKNGEKQVKLLGELTVQATMLEIDPDPKSKFHKPNKTLTDAWNTLTPKAQEIYREMRTFYENQIDGMVQDMLARVDRNITDPTKRTQMRKDIMDEFGPAKRKGPYFPLRRFGQYWFQVGKGADKEFYMFESVGDRDFWMAERQKELVAAKRQDLADSMASGDSLREGANSLNSALASEPIMQKVEKMIDDAALNLADPIKQARAVDELKDGIKQLQYLLLPSTNLRKAFIHRKGIAGASPDLVRVFSTSAVNLAYQRARVKYSEQFYNNIENGFAFLEGAPNNEDTRTMRDLLNELDSRASHVVGLEPTGALEKTSNIVTQGTFLWLLTAPASAMVNVFGAGAVAMPYIGARYGYDKAMGKISSYAAKYVATAPKVKEGNTFFPTLDKSTNLDPIQAAAYQQFLHDNTIDVSLTQDIMGLGQAPFEDQSLAKNRLVRGVSALFHHSERMSREIMNMAAFDLAYADNVEKGMAPGVGGQAFKEAIETAKDLTMMSIGDFTRASKPPILTGPVTRIVFQFKQYSLLMTYNLLRNTMIGFNPLRENITDEQKAEAREARRRMYGVLGVTALFAGLKGMPIFTATGMMAEVLNTIFGDDEEEEFIFEYWLQKELADAFGGAAAASLMTGLIANATNTALSERMSLDLVDLWFRDGTYQKSAEDTMREQFTSLLGPSVSIGLSFGRALDLHNNGQTDRALEAVSPTILRNLQIVGRYIREGEAATARGITIDDDISYSDLFARALGFTPEDIMRKQKAIIDRKGVQTKIEARRERILSALQLSVFTGDSDLYDSTMERVDEYNEAFPEFPIDNETIEQSLNRRMDDIAKQEALGGVSEKLYGRIEEAIPTRD